MVQVRGWQRVGTLFGWFASSTQPMPESIDVDWEGAGTYVIEWWDNSGATGGDYSNTEYLIAEGRVVIPEPPEAGTVIEVELSPRP